MTNAPVWVELNAASLESMRCCGISNPAHPGRLRKIGWLKQHFKKGLRAKILLAPDGRQCGYIEYLPGEYAWRGVDAAGYLFIHCIWTHFRKYQGLGLAKEVVEACVKEARENGMKGVAVVARDGPWLAGPELFLACGFEVAETAPPDYRLLVRKFNASAANPKFVGGWDEKLKKYDGGLTIIHSAQCPYAEKFTAEIAETAEQEFGVKPRIVELKSHRDAQKAPTPYAVFSIIRDGRLLADHQISRTRFRNLMREKSKSRQSRPRRLERTIRRSPR